MASKGQPLGIGLAIDFSSLDAQLSQVANKIEKVGKEASLNVGSLAGLKAGGGIEGDKMAEQVAQVGMALSRGMASGIRTSDAVLLGFAARINAVLDRMSQTIVEMFNRIDVAMKGHRWTNMLTGLSNALGNWAGGGKALSPLEKALGGAFGGIAKRGSAVLNTMFENLGKTMTTAMEKAAASMAAVMEKAAKQIESTMKSSLDAISVTVIGLSRTLSTSMLTAINQIAARFKDLKASAEGVTGAGPGRPYVRQPGAIKEMKPIVDIDTKLKPPSKATWIGSPRALARCLIDLQAALFEKAPRSRPSRPSSRARCPSRGCSRSSRRSPRMS